jgi:hypothetical protein
MKMKNVKKEKTNCHKDNDDVNSYYITVKSGQFINPNDYEFLSENYKLSKKDLEYFLSKPVEADQSKNFTSKQCLNWVTDFAHRCKRYPTLKDYYAFEGLISSY